ncbi:putative sodium/potassium/calcium exchanger [Halobellus captivus]|uniref:hypothetical protein n=1 Tax=Halobellus captivus TaxID=2592614 RepID=UPI0011A655EB|nr:hypothetical protein [Halobellus captivus]
MTEFIEFGSKTAADSVREQFEEHLCSVDDDKRLKTVAFTSDTPESVLQQAEAQAQETRAEDRQGAVMSGPLSESTRKKIKKFDGFSKTNTTMSWRRAKGVYQREGHPERFFESISALADYDDPKEGAEAEIRARREGAVQHGTNSISGEMNRGEEDIQDDRTIADAARTVQSEGCDHARDHCEHGDSEACEFLQEACGFDEGEVNELLTVTDGGREEIEREITGQAAGALKRSWQGYQGATADLAEAIEQVAEKWENAQQAAKAINAVREKHGQDPIHFEKLEGANAKLQDLQRTTAAGCHECHANHEGHEHPDHEREREVLDMDDQQTLGGDRADDQARFAGGETGNVESEVEQPTEKNPGGLRADQREGTGGETTTQQSVPDEFNVAEGGQETL